MVDSRIKFFLHSRTRNELFFFLALLIYIIFSTIDNHTYLGQIEVIASICDLIKIIVFISLAIHAVIHIKEFTVKQIILFALYGILAIVCFVVNRTIGPIVFLLFWINIKEIKFKDILLAYLFAVSFIALITIACVILRIIPDNILDGYRHALGFLHANTMGALVMTFVMCYVAYQYDHIKWYEYLLCLIVSTIVFVLSRSKGAFICTIVVLIMSMFVKSGLSPIGEWIMTVVSVCIYPVCSALVFGMSYFYTANNRFFILINRLLTNRPRLGNKAINNYGINLLGQNIVWTEESGKYNIVDSSYLRVAFNCGFIFLVVLIAMYTLLGCMAVRRKKWDLILVFITVALHAIIEGTLTDVTFNPVVIAIGCIFYETIFSNVNEKNDSSDILN